MWGDKFTDTRCSWTFHLFPSFVPQWSNLNCVITLNQNIQHEYSSSETVSRDQPSEHDSLKRAGWNHEVFVNTTWSNCADSSFLSLWQYRGGTRQLRVAFHDFSSVWRYFLQNVNAAADFTGQSWRSQTTFNCWQRFFRINESTAESDEVFITHFSKE